MKYYLILILIILSCTSEKSTFTSDVEKLSIQVPFPADLSVSTELIDDRVLYFAELVTYKQIVKYDLYDNEQVTIDLNELLDSLNYDLIDFEVVDSSEICLLTKNERLLFIDHQSKLLKDIDLSFLKEKGVKSYYPIEYDGNCFHLGLSSYEYSEKPTLTMEDYIEMERLKRTKPVVLSFENIVNLNDMESLKFNWGNIYNRFLKKSDVSTEGNRFSLDGVENKYFHSIYSDTLYQYNQDFKLENAIKIKSNLVEGIGSNKLSISEHLDANKKVLFNKNITYIDFVCNSSDSGIIVFLKSVLRTENGKTQQRMVIQEYNNNGQLKNESLLEENLNVRNIINFKGDFYVQEKGHKKKFVLINLKDLK
ncbi:hypothetical protein [Lishizhenia tianjinensis]|nr:hypothetical protein [Lishizhenia tianjinensis]